MPEHVKHNTGKYFSLSMKITAALYLILMSIFSIRPADELIKTAITIASFGLPVDFSMLIKNVKAKIIK